MASLKPGMSSVKLVVKKVYCTKCQKLVMPNQEQEKTDLRLLCPRCQGVIYTRGFFTWRRAQ